MYYADIVSRVVSRVYLNGSSPEILLTLQFEYIGESTYMHGSHSMTSNDYYIGKLLISSFSFVPPEDLAVDWVANNLYWTDGVARRIEVFDLDTRSKAVLVSTDVHSAPRAIVVDPSTRLADS